MSLTGSFATMPFADLLQWIGDARRSGTLQVALEVEERWLRFEDGLIVAYGSDDPMARDLGRMCLRRKLISEPSLLDAIAAQAQSQMPLSDVLVVRGAVDADALERAVRAHVEETVLDLFLWPEGRFTLTDRAPPEASEWMPPEYHLAEPIHVREVLMEGLRRLDEWNRIVKVLPSDDVQLHALGPAEDLPLLEDIAAHPEPPSLGQLLAERGDARYSICEELVRAYERGLLAVEARPPQPEPKTGHGATTVAHLVHAAEALIAEQQHEEAVTLLRTALGLDPFRQDARALLKRVRDAQLEELYAYLPREHVPKRTRRDPAGLAARDRALLHQVNGRWDVSAYVITSGLGELETLRALRRLKHAGLVT